MNTPAQEVTLFLIEDDDVDAMMIERSFEKNKIANKIVRAIDGVDAFEKLESNFVTNPFVILLDLQMPRMNGLEFLTKLRANDKYSALVVFVLTTSENENDILASYKQHISGYFVKGKVGDNFIDIVNTLNSYWKIVHLPNPV
ncbi:response regulator [Marinicellulosiphila megalodicopiae]|uniref:response regulator n=1 Tax=Marinicellulosiphila megalodicopiae TaxID=2724896 RepID=UPI003BAF6877